MSFACFLEETSTKGISQGKEFTAYPFSSQLEVYKLKINKMVIIQSLDPSFLACAPQGFTWHHVAKQTQAYLTVGKHLMRALFDFMFGKLLGDAETAFTSLKNGLIICTRNTQRGSSKFKCWGIRPPGDLLKECRCFLSSTHYEITLII